MITPSSLIKQASDRLVDQESGYEYETWSEVQLLAAFNFAVGIIAQQKPEEFAEPHRVELKPGSLQKVSDCEQFVAPFILLDARGDYVADLRSSVARGFIRNRSVCRRGEYRALSFTKTSEHTFEVWPALEEGDGKYYVQGLCMNTPIAVDMDTPVDIAKYLHPVILELMMHYAHAYDIEATPSRDRAAMHWANAMTLLGVRVARS